MLTGIGQAQSDLPLVPATNPAHQVGLVAIIIDDLGNSLRDGRRVIRLPAPIACAILPHTRHSVRLAREAYEQHKDVLLHLPMEPLVETEPPGPGLINTTMPRRELMITLDYNLKTVPHAVGISNHMGSRLTQDERTMRWLMDALRQRRNLFFVDSRTSPQSLAARMASAHGVPYLARNVFLDNEPTPDAIRKRLEETIAVARRTGTAIAIGHPHATTMTALEQWLPTLSARNIKLVSLSDMVTRQGARGSNTLVGSGLTVSGQDRNRRTTDK